MKATIKEETKHFVIGMQCNIVNLTGDSKSLLEGIDKNSGEIIKEWVKKSKFDMSEG